MRNRLRRPSSGRRRWPGAGWERPPGWAMVTMASGLVALAATLPLVLREGAHPPAETATGMAAQAPQAPARMTAAPVDRPTDRPLRVLFIGDSLTWGSFASNEDLTYRAQIVSRLSAGGPVEPVLVGGPGERADEAAEGLTEVSGPIDVAFVQVGANDSVAITPEEFRVDYHTLLDGVRELAPDAGLICAGVWNGPKLAAGMDRELRPVCAAHDGLMVPLSKLYVDETLRGPEGSPLPSGGVRDQFHPNDAGHTAVAEAMLAALDY